MERIWDPEQNPYLYYAGITGDSISRAGDLAHLGANLYGAFTENRNFLPHYFRILNTGNALKAGGRLYDYYSNRWNKDSYDNQGGLSFRQGRNRIYLPRFNEKSIKYRRFFKRGRYYRRRRRWY